MQEYNSPNRLRRETVRQSEVHRTYNTNDEETYLRQPSVVQHGQDIEDELEAYFKQQLGKY